MTPNLQALPPLDELSLATPSLWTAHDIDDVFAVLRRERPVSWQPEPETAWRGQDRGTWALVRHPDVVAASRDHRRFVSRFGVGTTTDPDPPAGMLTRDDPEHRALRGITSACFSPRSVAALRQRLGRLVESYVDRCAQLGEFDFVAEVAAPLPAEVVLDWLGAPAADRPELLRLTALVFGTDPVQSKQAELELARWGAGYVRERRSAGSPAAPRDLLDVIADGRLDERTLSEREAGEYFDLLLTAGSETTGTVLAHAVAALDRFPVQQAAWRADFDELAGSAVEELIRWATPVRRFCRTAIEDVEIAGTTIAAGDKVMLWYTSANRDETVFDAPRELRLARAPNPHVGFGGGGPHFCLGTHLARLELRLFFATFFRCFPRFEVASPVIRAPDDGVNVLHELTVRAA